MRWGNQLKSIKINIFAFVHFRLEWRMNTIHFCEPVGAVRRRAGRWSVISLLAGVSCMTTGRSVGQPDEHPNVLLIVADDLGVELGCYGDVQALSPQIDRLAGQGTRFQTAWVTAASCSPSRSSIHTGLYPHQNGQVGLSHHGFSMNRPYPTIASLLKKSGYRTGVVGKFHIAPEESCPWDYRITQEINREMLADNRDVRGMTMAAEGFVAGNTGPFFLMMSYIDPHVPLYSQRLGLPPHPRGAEDVTAMPVSGYSSPVLKQRTADYYNCIKRLDTGIGLLMEMLERHKVLDNTLIIFIGDHGPPFARAKMSNYDRGLRIPFIVRGPGVRAGRASGQPVSTVDILPTILDFAGLEAPEDLPGMTLRAVLEGRQPDRSERPLYASYHAHQRDAVFPMRAVRRRDWLLIENLLPGELRPRAETDGCEIWPAKDGAALDGVDIEAVYAIYRHPPRYELYNLETDPFCFSNQAEVPEQTALRGELIRNLEAWRKATGDPALKP